MLCDAVNVAGTGALRIRVGGHGGALSAAVRRASYARAERRRRQIWASYAIQIIFSGPMHI